MPSCQACSNKFHCDSMLQHVYLIFNKLYNDQQYKHRVIYILCPQLFGTIAYFSSIFDLLKIYPNQMIHVVFKDFHLILHILLTKLIENDTWSCEIE